MTTTKKNVLGENVYFLLFFFVTFRTVMRGEINGIVAITGRVNDVVCLRHAVSDAHNSFRNYNLSFNLVAILFYFVSIILYAF